MINFELKFYRLEQAFSEERDLHRSEITAKTVEVNKLRTEITQLRGLLQATSGKLDCEDFRASCITFQHADMSSSTGIQQLIATDISGGCQHHTSSTE